MDVPQFEEYFKQIKFNLRLIGIPYNDFKFYPRYYIFLASLTIMVTEEVAFVIEAAQSNNVNFLDVTQLAPCIGIGVLSILKLIFISTKRHNIYHLTENLKTLYTAIENDPAKINLTRTNFIYLKMLIKYFFTLNMILVSVYNFASPIIILFSYLNGRNLEFVLPYAVWLPFDVNSWLPWSLVFVHSVISGYICILYFTSVDILYCVLTTHICAIFSTISDRIKDLDETNAHQLRDIVKDHQIILKLSDDLENIFTAANLMNVLVGSVQICALGFNLTMGDLQQIPGCLLFLVSVLIQILMMSIFGENIINESSKIGEMAYICKWYKMDRSSKKIILAVITRSLKPQKLTAYKFSVISYGSFSKIISTSWSYFTILRSCYVPSENNAE